MTTSLAYVRFHIMDAFNISLVSTVIPIYCVLVCCGLRFVVVLAVFTATCFSNVAVMPSLDVRLSVRDVGDS